MNLRTLHLLKLHKLYAPADEHGSDAGGTDTAVEDEPDEAEEQDADAGEEAGAEEEEPEEVADEVSVTIGDEAEPEDEAKAAPTWVRDLRKSNREKDRVIRQLQAQVAAREQPAQAVTLGAKPTLEGCDYDADKFASDLEAWHGRKIEVERQDNERKAKEKQVQDQWATRLDNSNKAKSELKVQDYEEAEAVVQDTLSVVQQGILVSGAKNSAVLMYALGKNPKKAKELAAISDPVQFAWAAAQLEKDLKVTPRKAAPLPERTVKGSVSAATSAVSSSQLEALQKKAQASGDYTEYLAAKRKAKG